MLDVFFRFLVLGCMSFGGPVAHIGYFQREFVDRRKWIEEDKFTSALSLCQFLPGPASSQLGMFIGYHRAGYLGAIAAFVGFTFPSFALLTAAAVYATQLGDSTWFGLLISAAKLLAVVVVADAIWTMGRKFISDGVTFVVCIGSAAWILWQTGLVAQLMPIVLAGVLGWLFIRKPQPETETPKPTGLRQTLVLFSLFGALLVLPALSNTPLISMFNHFYQAGSFVFGGGHVVLPLLQPLIGDAVSGDALVEGYAAAQLVPGPMFTIASYVGASMDGIHPVIGSIIATIAIFLPGALLLFAALPVWQTVMGHPKFAGSVVLINAAVVGLLVAAFYQPVWVSAVYGIGDIVAVIVGFIVLRKFNLSVFWLLSGMLAYVVIKSML
ncbi:chromate efflux transporter [Enterovibrio nigricans]|uniref:Chromate transporter n=1 Tax=Enterovibrio nigricans DSM 22720 TaxID=1121868 RepID=A0A1T4V6G5_9GAMM|nr:chromate efflux transporter [Enterovibrio nigricans]PKF50400.1 chorismate-binding protein [Enterovibrio nigricans]SKA60121.1 chromate transporter [Enterovibrio nigricans DSM 22720]